MPWISRRLGFLIALYLAAVAYFLVAWLPTVVDSYTRLAETHPRLSYAYLAAISVGGFVLASLSIWLLFQLARNTFAKQRRTERRGKNPSELSATQKQTELKDNLATGQRYAQDQRVSNTLRSEIEHSLAELEEKQSRSRLEIVAFGTISSGKSTLLNALAGRDVFASEVVGGTTSVRSEIPWPGKDEVVLVDTPGLAEVRGEGRAAEAAHAAKDSDLVLLVVDGPLKAYEVDLVDVLATMEKRILVCLNKEDWYEEDQQNDLLRQIAQQLPKVAADDIVAVRAGITSQRRIRVAPDGTEQEERIELPPDVQALARRMLAVVDRDGRDLLLANLLLQSRGLVDDAKDRVRAVLDKQAEEIIGRHMWAAGGAAGINPIPLLDIAGGTAITVKMVLELAHVYRQPIDADIVVKMLEQLGKNLIAMVGTTAATPAVAGAIAGMLKTVPGIGTLAGGLLQGVVQAVITRWIGNVFVEYFRQEMKPPPGGLAELARSQWEAMTQPTALRSLIQLGRKQLQDPPEK